jgi:hypothetical protein
VKGTWRYTVKAKYKGRCSKSVLLFLLAIDSHSDKKCNIKKQLTSLHFLCHVGTYGGSMAKEDIVKNYGQ